MKTITTIPGDGIGKEVMAAGLYILDNLNLNIEYKPRSRLRTIPKNRQ